MNNKQQTLVVLGAAESGIGAALLGVQQGWDVWVSDQGSIAPHFKAELQNAGIAFEENGHTESLVSAADVIVKSPGIPEKASIMRQLRAEKKRVISEIEFAYWYKAEAKIVAITGSNGKSTTTMLTHHLLKEGGVKVAMVGNIGYSFARQIALQPADWYVAEISSFQLDDIEHFRPDVAIILNISPDHLDRYDYDFNKYIASKFRITQNQTSNDILILNKDDEAIMRHLHTHPNIHAKTIFITMSQLPQNEQGAYKDQEHIHINYDGQELDWSIHDLTIKGRHNQYNSMAAGISASAAGVRNERIRESLSSFKGLEHRLEFVGSIKGISFINDSKATNVNSVWYALESMSQPTILILGGQDKGNDYSELAELVREKVKAIVCMGVDNTPIVKFFSDVVPTLIETHTAQDAVLAAYSLAEKGDAVLLSPACASFDLFKNYEERGNAFKSAVKNL